MAGAQLVPPTLSHPPNPTAIGAAEPGDIGTLASPEHHWQPLQKLWSWRRGWSSDPRSHVFAFMPLTKLSSPAGMSEGGWGRVNRSSHSQGRPGWRCVTLRVAHHWGHVTMSHSHQRHQMWTLPQPQGTFALCPLVGTQLGWDAVGRLALHLPGMLEGRIWGFGKLLWLTVTCHCLCPPKIFP